MYVELAQPQVEPVAVSDMHDHSEIIDSDRDNLLKLYIGAARRYAESYTGRSFMTRQWQYIADSFPGCLAQGFAAFGSVFSIPPNAFLLEKGPVQSVDSITYLAMDGTTKTVATSVYIATGLAVGQAAHNVPCRIAPRFGQIWPSDVMPQIGSVQVTFTAGYDATDTSKVPEGIRHWIMVRTATAYENREAYAILPRGKVEPLPFVDTLLDPFCIELA